MANVPIDVRALISAGSKLMEQRDLPVRIAVLVEIDAPETLVDAVREGFRPRTSKAIVDVSIIEPETVLRVVSAADAAVVLVGTGGGDIGPTLADLRGRAIPTAVLAIRAEPGDLAGLVGHPGEDVLTRPDAFELVHGPLADWIMRRLPAKRTAVAHNFEFMRRAVAHEAVKATAWQNAVIGGVGIIPGTDMPLMTLNQGKMLLQISAAYGQQLGADRIKELAAVVGGGFLLRTIARQALTLIPGFGWAVKAGVAYSGTIAMGDAAIAYFERGGDAGEMLARLRESAGKVASSAKGRLRRGRGSAPRSTDYIALPPICGEPETTASPGGATTPESGAAS